MSNAILLVEDAATDEKLTLRMFRRSNLQNEIVIVRDGSEAIDYLLGKDQAGEFNDLPALVLLDLKLPRISGLEVDFCAFTEAARTLGLFWLLSSEPALAR
jgi:two-component system response regulator